MTDYTTQKFPKTRIATLDVCAIGLRKHHVAAMVELDVQESREKIKRYKRENSKISFTAWFIKVVSHTIKNNETAAAFLKGKRSVLVFNDINVSLLIEKEINGHKVPVPLIIEKANERSIESITKQIDEAKGAVFTDNDIVLQHKTERIERFYYHLPGFIRRLIWRCFLLHPRLVFPKMGNVAVTSIGTVGNTSGWFIPISVHPVCFGTGTITKKPVVADNKIEIREMLNMTVLLDHDVMDGAPMARFIRELSNNIRNGIFLQK